MQTKHDVYVTATTAIFCLLVGGCDAEQPEAETRLRTANCERKLVVVPDECIAAHTETSVTLRQCDDPEHRHMELIAVGNVLVDDDGELAREIAAIADDGLTLTTVQASLGELDAAAEDDAASPTEFDDALDNALDSALEQGLSLLQANQTVTLYEHENNKLTAGGTFELRPHFDFDFGFQRTGFFPSLSSFRLVVGGTMKASTSLGIHLEAGEVVPKTSANLVRQDFQQTVALGPVPCHLRTTVAVDAKLGARSENSEPLDATGTFEIDAEVGFGPVYENGAWRFEHGAALEPTLTLPTLDAKLIAEFGLQVKIETHLWEVFGGTFTIEPYVEFDVDPSREGAKLQVSGGVAPSVSFEMGRLGRYDAPLDAYNVF